MTDSSSNEMADIAAELLEAKMESAKKEGQLTHVLKIGTFHMEIVPDKNISIQEIFNNTLDKLIDKFGDKLLEISIQQTHADKSDIGKHYG